MQKRNEGGLPLEDSDPEIIEEEESTAEGHPQSFWERRRKVMIASALSLILVFNAGYLAIGWQIYSTLAVARSGCGDGCHNTPDNFNQSWGSDKWSDFNYEDYWMSNYENVTFKGGDDGITLSAWWITANESGDAGEAPTVIVVHGLRSNKYEHGMLVVAGMLHNAGINALVVDMRDHGDSTEEDGRVSIGIKEYRDVMASVDWLIDEKGIPEERIGLFGASMGAGTSSIAFGMDNRIQSVVLDNGYLDLDVIIREELAREGYPTWLASACVWSAYLFAGEALLEPAPSVAFENHYDRPIFVIHGEMDDRVLPHHSRDMVALGEQTGANVSSWFIEDTGHGEAKMTYPEEYSEKVTGFFLDTLHGTPSG